MKKSIVLTLLFSPLAVSAQYDFYSLIESIHRYLQQIVPLLIGIAIVVFFWGMVVFIFRSSDEREREAGKRKMVWGIFAIFVMVALWGSIAFLDNTLELDDTLPPIPQVNEGDGF